MKRIAACRTTSRARACGPRSSGRTSDTPSTNGGTQSQREHRAGHGDDLQRGVLARSLWQECSARGRDSSRWQRTSLGVSLAGTVRAGPSGLPKPCPAAGWVRESPGGRRLRTRFDVTMIAAPTSSDGSVSAIRLEDLALVGNCQIAALIERRGAIVWCCMPRFDSEPIFGALLDEQNGGRFTVEPARGGAGTQRYLENTNVLETRFDDEDGSFRLLDFAPRFSLYDRMFRPTQLVRIVEPLEGSPRVCVRCEPRLGWSRHEPVAQHGSNHVDYGGFDSNLRLTTDVPLAYLDARPFVLAGRRHLVLSWGAPIEEPLQPLCDRFLAETVRYWQRWVKHCNIPPRYQREVIRSALVLKLHCYEDTGAIVAAMTTSIPESPASGRNWDYRHCWLRDAYYALGAFRRLGHFEERERFLSYLVDVVAGTPDLHLAPLYRIDGTSDLHERVLEGWPGFAGHGPVRIGNGAAMHAQHDVFGEMVLALAPIFLDDRFSAERSETTLDVLERLARKAISVVGSPDAGIWEYRTEWKPQTFSSTMCWAAADRMATVAARHRPAVASEFRHAASRIREEIAARAWNPELGSFVASYDGTDLDASLLQMATLRFLPADDPRLHGTIDAIERSLSKDGWLFRYRVDDGFGAPEVAFVICTFWLVEALAIVGRSALPSTPVIPRRRARRSPNHCVSARGRRSPTCVRWETPAARWARTYDDSCWERR
ncbi:MAG TPA: glycoside hydrolase family 15 protein [Nannocystaceae bacterium]|nr:glycoside hydrolase family 15 protein [Nannocystaceae bacterium]